MSKTNNHGRYFIVVTIALCLPFLGLVGCAGTKDNVPKYNIAPKVDWGNPELQPTSNSHEADISKDLPKMTSEEYEELGDDYFRKGNLPMALVQYNKAFTLNINNATLIYKKGLLFLAGNMNEDAIKMFQELIKRQPEFALSYQGLGQAFFQMKQYEKAEKEFQRAIGLDSKLWNSHNLLGIIFDYQKRFADAVSEYNSAVALRPDLGFLYNNLGVSYCLGGEYQKAIEAFQKAIENKYISMKVYNNLGLALSKVGKYEEAFIAFKEAGDESKAYNNLGCVFLDQGEYKKAINYFEKAIEIKPHFYAIASNNLKKAKAGYSNGAHIKNTRELNELGDDDLLLGNKAGMKDLGDGEYLLRD